MPVEQELANAANFGDESLFPARDDARVRNGLVFPKLFPRFTIAKGTSVFTMGSCFVRHIEEKLPEFDLPTLGFRTSNKERMGGNGRPNAVLNEFNPGTMCQRAELAARRASFESLCICPENDGFIDLMLSKYVNSASMDRILQRRAEIDRVYASLFRCETAIVTLGLVEAWYDNVTKLYLNRMPPPVDVLGGRGRYEMRILDVDDAYPLLERMVQALMTMNVKKILLTVSPVPLEATFSGTDCVTANTFSKSVLLVCARRLTRKFPEVDYYPGYEIVTSGGPASFRDDARHIQDDVVEQVTSYMLEHYVPEMK
ncbi:MAG TPA: GSCFA domain-containing protein [Candidatus Angelobacter sp.]|jgi:hypothetical protein